MGNHKISITAEFASLIKSRTDEKYNYFVSNKTRKLYKLISNVFSKNAIDKIFHDRLTLSNEFGTFIEKNNFETIVEFGAGYSLRGFVYSLQNKDVIYIDTDFVGVIENKKQILFDICKDANIIYPDNYRLLSVDVLNDDLAEKLNSYLKNRNLFLAEGLTSYFNFKEYSKFLDRIRPFLKQFQNVFFSQENFLKKHSLVYMILRKLVVVMTRNKSYIKFKTKDDLTKFLTIKDLAIVMHISKMSIYFIESIKLFCPFLTSFNNVYLF
ncbi:MAG: hypothetical protein WCW02_00960 [Candidatus Buchananbacteria bacterium]